MPNANVVLIDLQAAENATAEDARDRLKVIKHYVRAVFGDDDINMKVKVILKQIGIEPASSWSVVAGYPLALAVLKKQHKCNGSMCVRKLKNKTAKKIERMKKKKALEKMRNAKKAAREMKQGNKKCTKSVQERKTSKIKASSSDDEFSIAVSEPPNYYI